MARQLTVSSSFRKRMWNKPVFNPKITISGKWLSELGFKIGDKINIEISNNQLIIINNGTANNDGKMHEGLLVQ
jgi:hypothetical protein